MCEPNASDHAKYIRRIQRKFQHDLCFEKKLKYLKYLSAVDVSLEILKETAIGKTINALRKEGGVIGELAGHLVLKWKDIAISQYDSSNDSSNQKIQLRKQCCKNNIKVNANNNTSSSSCNQNDNDLIVSDKTLKVKNEVYSTSGSKTQISHTNVENNTNITIDTINNDVSKKIFKQKFEYKNNESFSDNAITITQSCNKKHGKLYDEKCDISNKHLKIEKKTKEIELGSNEVKDGSRKKQNKSFEEMLMMPVLPTKKKKKYAEHQSNTQSRKFEPRMPTLPDIELPQITAVPVYHPCRPSLVVDPGEMVKRKVEPSLNVTDIKSRKTKSVMYTGKKISNGVVTSLYQLSMRVLIENVDALYETGGVPFSLLEPLLTKCSPSQLERLEYYNPHFVEDTDGLWKMHCQHDFKGHKIDNNTVGAWRDMYKDLCTKRELKLRQLSSKISANQAAKVPERSVKLAYVAGAPKPSVQVLRKQKKFGTADICENNGENQREIRERMDKEQRELAVHVPFAKVPRRDRCSKRPPSSLNANILNQAPTPKKRKEKEELGSHGPAEMMPQPKKKKGKKPMMLKAMKLLKKQKGRLGATIMRK